jgi:hypothetical protein
VRPGYRGFYGGGIYLGYGVPYGYAYAPGYAYGYGYDPGYAYDPGYSYGPGPSYGQAPPPAPQGCSAGGYDQYGNWIPNPNCATNQQQPYPQQQPNYDPNQPQGYYR